MTLQVSCPSCKSNFRVAEQYAGKKAKCPKCGSQIAIDAPTPSGTRAASTSGPQPTQNTPETATPAAPAKTKLSFLQDLRVRVTLAVILALVVGYFVGREHLKYEIRSAISDAGEALVGSLAESFADFSTDESFESDESENQNQITEFDEIFHAPSFDISIDSARIDKPEYTSYGEVTRDDEDNLIITLDIENTDDRKILRYKQESMLSGYNSHLIDDVGNMIRVEVSGFSSDHVGALTGREDILPGQAVFHSVFFAVPPPKTKYLVLTMDLDAFGGEGKARFKIPVDEIENF